MRREEVSMGMSRTVGGEEETRITWTGDWRTGTRTSTVNTTNSGLLKSDRLAFACTNSLVLGSATIVVVQQTLLWSVVNVSVVGFWRSAHIGQLPPCIIPPIEQEAMTTGMPTLNIPNTATRASAMIRYLRMLFIWL
jgi:hypothetical protein